LFEPVPLPLVWQAFERALRFGLVDPPTVEATWAAILKGATTTDAVADEWAARADAHERKFAAGAKGAKANNESTDDDDSFANSTFRSPSLFMLPISHYLPFSKFPYDCFYLCCFFCCFMCLF
jgi:hypothetical protein